MEKAESGEAPGCRAAAAMNKQEKRVMKRERSETEGLGRL